jgi:HemK-like putative methylase
MLSQEEKWLLEEGYGSEKSEAFFAACAQLSAGVPLAYLIGHIPFLDCKIYLDSKPLIPRPETEYWTQLAIEEIRKYSTGKKEPLHILDLCAGSGCIGVAIAKEIPDSKIEFIEFDKGHLPTIEKNCLENGIGASRFKIMQGDIFSPLTNESYDFILSNPPYIDPAIDRAEPSVKENEPDTALYGGHEGMELISKIIKESPKYLNPNGQLWLEHEPEQVDSIDKLAKSTFSTLIHNDQYKTPRFTQLVLQ